MTAMRLDYLEEPTRQQFENLVSSMLLSQVIRVFAVVCLVEKYINQMLKTALQQVQLQFRQATHKKEVLQAKVQVQQERKNLRH